jgi:glyoxylase-like metal-dependent hydrolase (beta-lactamase superfamily II)
MIVVAAMLAGTAAALPALEPVSGVRMYVMDCGVMPINNMALFSDTGKYDGQKGSTVDPCFLIQHPNGLLLWDNGLGDAFVGHDVPANNDGVAIHVERRLLDQLSEIGVSLANVTCLAFSHFHLDHTGNSNAFTSSTWIIN